MIVAQGGAFLDNTHAVDFNDQEVFPIGTPKVENDLSNFPPELHSNVCTVHY